MAESQIVAILKEAEAGMAVKDVCRQYDISNTTFYKWREKYAGMEASDIKLLKELKEKKRHLKQMYVDLNLKSQPQMEVVTIEKHVSNYPHPFYLKQGDKVTLGVIDDEFPHWIFITNDVGDQGWAPVQYIKRIEGSSLGVILQDYDNVELNTVIGETLCVLFELNGWYRVSRLTGEIGWLPVHSVQRT